MRLSTTCLLLLTLLTGRAVWASTHDAQAAHARHASTLSQPSAYQYAAHAAPPSSARLGLLGNSPVQTAPAQTGGPTLTFFPNPSRGPLTVQVAGQRGQDYKLRLSNILGREVRLQAVRPEQTTEGLAIDLTGLPAGLYFYSLLVNDKVVATKRLTLQGD